MTLSKLADQTQPAEVAHRDETNTDPSEKPSTPSTFAELARQRNWGVGDQSLAPDPKTDRVFITTTGTTDPNWEPGEEDWKRLAELFRG